MAKMRPKTPPAKDPDQVDFKGDEQLANDYKKMYNRYTEREYQCFGQIDSVMFFFAGSMRWKIGTMNCWPNKTTKGTTVKT